MTQMSHMTQFSHAFAADQIENCLYSFNSFFKIIPVVPWRPESIPLLLRDINRRLTVLEELKATQEEREKVNQVILSFFLILLLLFDDVLIKSFFSITYFFSS